MKKLWKKLSDGEKRMLIGFIIWFVPTACYGFNEEPVNGFERFTDNLGGFLIIWGLLQNIFTYITINNNINLSSEVMKSVIKCIEKRMEKMDDR